MTIPAPEPWPDVDLGVEWIALSAAGKRERILCAAGRVFSARGLDAPMPLVAAAAGAGVASVYRQFPSKHDLLAALVTRRLEQIARAAREAIDTDRDRWRALTELLWTVIEEQSGDDFLGEAWDLMSSHPDVASAAGDATAALGELMAQARAEGRLRADATTLDIRLVFTATRAAKRIHPGAWRRMLALVIDGLDAGRVPSRV